MNPTRTPVGQKAACVTCSAGLKAATIAQKAILQYVLARLATDPLGRDVLVALDALSSQIKELRRDLHSHAADVQAPSSPREKDGSLDRTAADERAVVYPRVATRASLRGEASKSRSTGVGSTFLDDRGFLLAAL